MLCGFCSAEMPDPVLWLHEGAVEVRARERHVNIYISGRGGPRLVWMVQPVLVQVYQASIVMAYGIYYTLACGLCTRWCWRRSASISAQGCILDEGEARGRFAYGPSYRGRRILWTRTRPFPQKSTSRSATKVRELVSGIDDARARAEGDE